VETTALDHIDREILGHLMRNARMSFRELGECVSLSANATAERVRRLENRGVIAGYRAILDPAAAGRRLVALIDVRLTGPSARERFERLIDSLDEITDAAHVTGRFDYQLRAVCEDVDRLDALLGRLKTEGGVAATDTRLALRTVVRRPGPVG
jgi:Lrp/AsnC family transcriptional regulator, leucine-responsive regulatory protein